MKYILLDSEDGTFLDHHIERRGWDAVREQDLGDTILVWIKRTPEEKGERPYKLKKKYLEGMSMMDYINWKKDQVSEAMSKSTFNGQTYEFYKGQFLVLREILQSEYRTNVNFELLDKWRKEWEESEKEHWFIKKQYCGICKNVEMIHIQGSRDDTKHIAGFECPRCDAFLEITTYTDERPKRVNNG